MIKAVADRTFNISSFGITPSNPFGYSSSINAVVMFPDLNLACPITADKNGKLCPIPSISNRSRAVSIAEIAFVLSVDHVHNLAIIGS